MAPQWDPCHLPQIFRAIGAVVARFVHTEEVTGSNPVSPTRKALMPQGFLGNHCPVGHYSGPLTPISG